MLAKIKAKWSKLKGYAPGERFQKFRQGERDTPPAVKALYVGLAVVSLAVGVILVFIPGPAVLFFALAGALLATQSMWVARALDRAEVKLRGWSKSIKSWWRRRGSSRALPKKRTVH